MCKFLKISRTVFYYSPSPIKHDISLFNYVIDIFKRSRNNYGTRKIKVELTKLGFIVSRKKIAKIMRMYNLVSNYTKFSYKKTKTEVNTSNNDNILNRDFDVSSHTKMRTIVSDLTYVKVDNKWNYICILLDLFNREIVGYSSGANKTAELVLSSFAKVKGNLNEIQLFHTDRGKEFDNMVLNKMFKTFGINHSLSYKGSPHDNAVAEATFKLIKTEFVKPNKFNKLEELKMKLADYINWFNKSRIHSTLGYLSPIEYKQKHL